MSVSHVLLELSPIITTQSVTNALAKRFPQMMACAAKFAQQTRFQKTTEVDAALVEQVKCQAQITRSARNAQELPSPTWQTVAGSIAWIALYQRSNFGTRSAPDVLMARFPLKISLTAPHVVLWKWLAKMA